MVRWMMEKRGTMGMKGRHVERGKEKTQTGGKMGREAIFVTTHRTQIF